MLEPNNDLEGMFERAIEVAAKHKHEYITLEHFLYSMITDEKFKGMLKDFGAEVELLKKSLEKFIRDDLNDIKTDKENYYCRTYVESCVYTSIIWRTYCN